MKKKRRNILQRFLAVMLSAVLTAGTVSGGVFPMQARAAEDTPDLSGNEARYSTDGGQTWTEAKTLFDIIWLGLSGDVQIELLRDITLVAGSGGNWADYTQMMGRQDSTWIIDGKGFTITRGESVRCTPFAVTQTNSKVILRNITMDGGAIWEGDDPASRTNSGIQVSGATAQLIAVGGEGSELILENGAIIQNNDLGDTAYGAGVVIGYSGKPGTLTLKEGCAIRNNRANAGAGICVYHSDSVLRMEGGSIYGNYASNNGTGGGVINLGIFYMEGGSIYGNVAAFHGGGVRDRGTFQMTGGEIRGNKGGAGGGGGISVFAGNTTITGGSVTGNEISGGVLGGGVLLSQGSLTIAGSSVITNNTDKNGSANNVFLQSGKTISVSGALNDGAAVGVTTADKPTEGNSVPVSGANGADYSSFFSSDVESYDIINEDNTLKLSLHVHQYTTQKWDENGHWMECSCGDKEAETAHTPGADWAFDENNHWHVCTSCPQETDIAAHTEDGGEVTKEPTATEEGEKTYKCSTCGYVLRTESIEKTGGGEQKPDAGSVEVEKVQGTGAPDMTLDTTKEELIPLVLTKEEQDSIKTGTDVKILLTVDNIDASVKEEDKQAVEEKKGDYTVGEYLDINLIKIIGETQTPVTHTDKNIRITITLPESLRNHDSQKTRTFAIVRVHEGVAELLPDLDSAEDTVTIETDKFSTYALVYHEEDKNAGTESGGTESGGTEGGGTESGGTEGGGTESGGTESGGTESGGTEGGGTESGDNGGSDDSDDGDDSGAESGSASTSGSANTNGSASTSGSAGTSGSASTNGSSGANGSSGKVNAGKDKEPKTGDSSSIEIYATLLMIAGFSYLLLYFENKKRGMTEWEKNEIVEKLIAWGKKGGKLRRTAALAVIFFVLVYYHGIGKKICVDYCWF